MIGEAEFRRAQAAHSGDDEGVWELSSGAKVEEGAFEVVTRDETEGVGAHDAKVRDGARWRPEMKVSSRPRSHEETVG